MNLLFSFIRMCILFIIVLAFAIMPLEAQTIPKWEKGYLDIHQISTRNGNASFIVLPDGTTILVDAGDLNKEAFQKRHYPLKVSPSIKGDSVTTGRIIRNYINKILGSPIHSIDYFILTHFHSDHYGELSADSPLSQTHEYFQTGVTELGDLINIHKFVVRDYPVQLPLGWDSLKLGKNLNNLLKFIEYQRKKGGMELIKAKAGALNQIKPLYEEIPQLSIRTIKANNQVWSGIEGHAVNIFPYGSFF